MYHHISGREGKVSADGVSLSGWSNQEGVENVIEVAEEDWDELVNSKKHVLLFWYTPWCIRCLDVLKPQFIQVLLTFIFSSQKPSRLPMIFLNFDQIHCSPCAMAIPKRI